MKFLLRATLVYLLITLIVFGAGGIITYNIFIDAIQLETDRYLIERYRDISTYIKEDPGFSSITDSKITIIPVSELPKRPERRRDRFQFTDTLVWHQGLKRMENNRKLTSFVKTEEQNFRIEIHDVIVERDDIFRSVFDSQTWLFVILGVVMVISSFLISTWMFRPFNQTLEKIKSFNIKSMQSTSLGRSGIKEFDILNGFINQMTEKVSSDYKNLKEFTENASHELQTPLAITKGKLELLLQQENLSREQIDLIESSYDSITYMSKLNKSLTLLSKIENEEFSNKESINISAELNKALAEFDDLIKLKNLKLESNIQENVITKNDKTLIKVLINNLLQNAIRHNNEGGKINVELFENILIIKNTGASLDIPGEQLFERFKKGIHSEKNSGLGLSIVHKICEISHYRISYDIDGEWHKVTITF
jgi:signal transduction histidine kinase